MNPKSLLLKKSSVGEVEVKYLDLPEIKKRANMEIQKKKRDSQIKNLQRKVESVLKLTKNHENNQPNLCLKKSLFKSPRK